LATPRRLWCSCTIIDYLKGEARAAEHCDAILAQAERGELEIVVSALAAAEVAKVNDASDEAEELISEFFSRFYVVVANVDVRVAREARRIVRTYGLKPLDAVHFATALVHGIGVLETYDDEMIRKLDRKEGDPRVTVRMPLYEGTARIPGF